MQITEVLSQNYQSRTANEAAQQNAKTHNAAKTQAAGETEQTYTAEELAQFEQSVQKFAANEFLAQTKAIFADSGSIFENGSYSLPQLSDRLANLVVDSAEDSEQLLKSGKNALFDSYNAASETWGGKLHDTTAKTLEEAVKAVDLRIKTLGFPILNMVA